ncbi:hypothetical protein [Roseateles sp. LYH14W]|uniref:Transposase n=1 Tax=Pelomonas parva TaxID=3299032 RepID=A0ABW7F8N3_9BURK
MHHYRQALLRMRQGDSDRDIAAARVMGRPKAAQWRLIATERGWLEVSLPLPDDETIAAALGSPRKASSTISTLASHRDQVGAWVEQGVSGTAIHAALKRRHGFTGSYSAVRRLVADIRSHLPPETTCRMDFEPGDAAQVDFGAGPTLVHPDGQPRRTWAFVMTLASSRHQYVEFVAPSPAPAPRTPPCSAPTPSAPRATASRSTPARRTTRRRRASWNPA